MNIIHCVYVEDTELSKQGGSKGKRIIITVLTVLAVLVMIVLEGARIYFRTPVKDYYKASEKEFLIPGLGNGMVPQGLDYIEYEGVYLVGGYQKNHKPSRIYRVKKSDGKNTGFVYLCDENGKEISPHAGGLAVDGKYVFVTGNDSDVYVYLLDDVLNKENGSAVNMAGRFSLRFGDDRIVPAWICFSDDRMIVGEFYRLPNYPTSDTHVFTGASNETNHALALCYRFSADETARFGIEMQPFEAYSLPGLVQGMAVHNGKIWLSQSWGTAKSRITCHDVKGSIPSGTIETDNGTINVYPVDSSTQVSAFNAPPMSEEIIFVDGKLLIMSESASRKYYFGNLTGGRWCYSTDVEKLKSGS